MHPNCLKFSLIAHFWYSNALNKLSKESEQLFVGEIPIQTPQNEIVPLGIVNEGTVRGCAVHEHSSLRKLEGVLMI